MEDFKEYTNSLSEYEKDYVNLFFGKKEYIEKLNATAINNCGNVITSSRGNCNSKISIIVDTKDNMDDVIRFSTPLFDSINISLWNIYITCINKDGKVNPMWDNMINYEINAVSPAFIFKFTSDKNSFEEEEVIYLNKNIHTVYINIEDVKYVLNEENFKTENYLYILNNFYKYVLQLIPIKEIEIEE